MIHSYTSGWHGEGDDIIADSPIEYNGYKFKFMNRNHCIAIMVEPDGTKWTCEYDYGFGAGFDEPNYNAVQESR